MIYGIIGGGIFGSNVGYQLAKKGYEVYIFEKENRRGMHQSGRSSGVLHSGIGHLRSNPDSLKVKFCIEGNYLARNYCKERGIEMEQCGTLIVATNDIEEERLEELLKKGKDAGIEGLSLLSAEELYKREPNIKARSALLSPNGAIINDKQFLESIAQDAQGHGAKYIMGAKVLGIDGTTIHTAQEKFHVDYIINCAGLYSDKIAHMMGMGLDYMIIPFKGEYMQLRGSPINSMVYQVPDPDFPFLGAHLTKTTDGKVLAGPTAMLALGRESYGKFQIDIAESLEILASQNFWRMFLEKENPFKLDKKFLKLVYHNTKIFLSKQAFAEEIKLLLPSINIEDIEPARAGIRAQAVDKKGNLLEDIVLERGKRSAHIINAVSPGLTCSIPFGKYIADLVEQ